MDNLESGENSQEKMQHLNTEEKSGIDVVSFRKV